MNKTIRIIIFIMLVIALSSMGYFVFAGSAAGVVNIRVGIHENVTSVNLSCEGDFRVIGEAGNTKLKLSSRDIYIVSVSGGGIKVKNKLLGKRASVSPAVNGNKLRINGRRYRGEINILLKTNGKLTVINELELEQYLYGVLPREISPEWPMAAMKAQAVVSRTYAFSNMGKHGSKGYDLSASVFCQVYGGMDCEDPRSNEAVNKTRGEVVTYRGELISTVFHSTCGGCTEKSSNVWKSNEKPAYLRGVRCNYCKKSPQYRWTRIIDKETIRKGLVRKGYRVGKINKIKIAGRSLSKRVLKFNVYHSEGKTVIPSNKFRVAVSPSLLRSTLLRLKNYKNSIKFVGRGWGHGVGLCQWGAKGMAERGYKYHRIIKKYFPGVKIKKK